MKIHPEIDDAFKTLRKHIVRLDSEKKTAHAKCEAEQKAKGLPVHHHTTECAEATAALSMINLTLHNHVWKP